MRWKGDVTDGRTRADRRLGPVVRVAPAKLNLTLAVAGRRPDGFHELHSVMVPLGLADRLSVAPAAGVHDTLRLEGGDLGPAADNLVLRAFAAVRAAAGRRLDAVPLAARLEKRIPVAAGLAGGSSDAAAAVAAALVAWDAAGVLDPAEVAEMQARTALQLGSDVPFFLAGGAALVTGRGERVEPLPPLDGAAPGLLLVTPAIRAETATVFAILDADPMAAPSDPRSTRASSEHLAAEWRTGLGTDGLVARAGVLGTANDLANAADIAVPGLRAMRRALGRRLGRPVGLSGSGPTLWVLYASEREAASAAEVVRSGLESGEIAAPGAGRPFILATTIAAARNRQHQPSGKEAT